MAPGDPPSTPCRYCRLLDKEARLPSRDRFSNPESAAKGILDLLGSGEAPEHVGFGGPGDPLRDTGLATVMRRIRTVAHLGSIVFTDGALLQDREVRREVAEADMIVTWLPALLRPGEAPRSPAAIDRRNAFDRHVEGIAALRRETQVRVVVEFEVRVAEIDIPASIVEWKRAIGTIHPHRVAVLPPGPSPTVETLAAIERVREGIGRIAGASLLDPTAADRRCWCGIEAGTFGFEEVTAPEEMSDEETSLDEVSSETTPLEEMPEEVRPDAPLPDALQSARRSEIR